MTRGRPVLGATSRRAQLLEIAAELFAEKGFHAVGIDDIGEAAGVTGPAIYRHFSSKTALLAALFNTRTDQMVERAAEIVARFPDGEEALRRLVRDQTEASVHDRAVMAVIVSEFRSLPEEDRLGIRLKQRAYVFDWMRALGKAHPTRSEGELRTLVHAAISVTRSVAYYQSSLDDESMIELVAAAAGAVLGLTREHTATLARADANNNG